ncbi:Protein of unknown function (DUF2034) [Geosmithia morbida]|uniref:Restriction endonuclease type IV Mrr domain-containing protein n=1 Tax=Geosmithia morbida TaxID=1094350 RepID=A0A9P4Z0S1_9HYPO|nr:Protein of unknown function (DUF2034) [Geosmithia morbida]KAF4126593.1 Protein of unknown function (DUF2034) [Geosmithia morbida]
MASSKDVLDGHSKHENRSSNDASKLIYPSAAAKSPHNSLETFVGYAERTGLDPRSTVYVGTRYEYQVAAALSRYGFHLVRVGGAGDYGTDLLGTWTPPTTGTALRLLVQCKGGAQRVGPNLVRELEGAFASAPPGWRGTGGGSDGGNANANVMGLLVGQRPATKGVRDSLGRSRWPMGYACCDAEGRVMQLMWNHRAADGGLGDLDVVTRRSHGDRGEQSEVVLVRQGKVLPFC